MSVDYEIQQNVSATTQQKKKKRKAELSLMSAEQRTENAAVVSMWTGLFFLALLRASRTFFENLQFKKKILLCANECQVLSDVVKNH